MTRMSSKVYVLNVPDSEANNSQGSTTTTMWPTTTFLHMYLDRHTTTYNNDATKVSPIRLTTGRNIEDSDIVILVVPNRSAEDSDIQY